MGTIIPPPFGLKTLIHLIFQTGETKQNISMFQGRQGSFQGAGGNFQGVGGDRRQSQGGPSCTTASGGSGRYEKYQPP